jgi:hypothetical protein
MNKTIKNIEKNIKTAIKNFDFNTERVEKYRLLQLKLDPSVLFTVDEAKDIVLGKILSKKTVVDLWNKHYGEVGIFGDCALCADKNSVNCVFPKIFQIDKTKTKFFTCKTCYDSILLRGLVKTRSCCVVETKRLKVWIKTNGLRRSTVCYCCQKEEINLLSSLWHAGHVEAKARDGSNEIINLKPICLSCNLDMAQINMYDYMKERKYHICKVPEFDDVIIEKMLSLLLS